MWHVEEAVRELAIVRWGLRDPTVTVLGDAGISSLTWLVVDGTSRWAAKAVPEGQAASGLGFEFGLHVADRLAAAEFRTGPPLKTLDGKVVAELEGWRVALLRFENGVPFSVTDLRAARTVGAHLGQLHLHLQPMSRNAARWNPTADLLGAPYLALRPGLEELAGEVVEAAVTAVDGFDIGLIHGDLDADEILLTPERTVAVLDWGSVHVAPQIFDLLTFHDEGCFAELLAGYLEVRPRAHVELEALHELERLHWLRRTAFWGARVLEPFPGAEQRQGFTNEYAFERSYEILLTGEWRP